ncbi:hypothetical protein AB0N09_34685 [Streptomyces erythrochromogenes]|uniref:hypothetical protein n=1 Tax=Streptomyces erythrochromogenes TaxID=285574 RepID=UPI00343A4522
MQWETLFTLCPNLAKNVDTMGMTLKEYAAVHRDEAIDLVKRAVTHPHGFTYSGVPYAAGPESWVDSPTDGDCSTLSEAFIYMLRELGIHADHKVTGSDVLAYAAHGIVGSDSDTNCGWPGYWFFSEHHWVSVDGIEYDLLFFGEAPSFEKANPIASVPVAGSPLLKLRNRELPRYEWLLKQFGEKTFYHTEDNILTTDYNSQPVVFDRLTAKGILYADIEWGYRADAPAAAINPTGARSRGCEIM